MTDPYRLPGTDETPRGTGPATAPRGLLRPVLWALLTVSLALNAALSTVNIFLGAAFGLVTLACVAGLVIHHYRYPRR